LGDRQRACGNPQCQTARRQKTQAEWRSRNTGYSIAWRLDQRAAVQPEAPEPVSSECLGQFWRAPKTVSINASLHLAPKLQNGD